MKRKRLLLFFTYGVSLKTWKESGTLERDLVLYKKLQEEGVDTLFITYGRKQDLEIAKEVDVNVFCNTFYLPRFIYFLFLPFLIFVKRIKFDLIKSHQFIGTLPAVIMHWLSKKKYYARGGYVPTYFFKSEKYNSIKHFFRYVMTLFDEILIAKYADKILVPSDEEKRYLQERHKRTKDSIFVLQPNWIDTNIFVTNPEIKKKNRSIIFIGRYEDQKNPILFLESIKDIPDISVTMVGAGSLYGDVVSFVKENGLNVKVHEDRIENSKLPKMLQEHQVYVLTTSFEGGSPKTLLEAMSCGLPVVASDTFGTREAFENEEHGLKCELNSTAFKKAITTLLNNEEICDKFGMQARKHIESHYSLDTVFTTEYSLINHLTSP
ncbi:glycosyltransferase family 4 protein [Candidatus Parcubacteria bacterium]|nr:glycosyltransferase family 4 protein [Candidatus Parcubacteria bacterium]MBT3948976.1 glycosyltransferase family 4 protein [Candidatus Parcubacteria bacterium]